MSVSIEKATERVERFIEVYAKDSPDIELIEWINLESGEHVPLLMEDLRALMEAANKAESRTKDDNDEPIPEALIPAHSPPSPLAELARRIQNESRSDTKKSVKIAISEIVTKWATEYQMEGAAPDLTRLLTAEATYSELIAASKAKLGR